MPQLTELLEDANQFIRSHRQAIESAPLQVYASALVFSPSHSRVRRLFVAEEPEWILTKPILEKRWNAYLQHTLESHSVKVAFSHDSALIALGSWFGSIRLWRTGAGDCVRELEGHSGYIASIAFSHDSKLIVSGSNDKTIRLWSTSTGNCLQVLIGHKDRITSVVFSHDLALIASGSTDKTIRLWSTSTGNCIRYFELYDGYILALAFSPDLALVASCSDSGLIQLWRTTTGEYMHPPTRPQKLIKYGRGVQSAAFSHNSAPIVLADADTRLWDVDTANHLRIGTANSLRRASFSHDAKLIAVSGNSRDTLQIWHIVTGKCVHELQGHSDEIWTYAFSHDSKLIASGSRDNMIRIWSVETGNCVQELRGHSYSVTSVAFSHNSKLIASASYDKTTRLWRVNTNDFQPEDPAIIKTGGGSFVFSNDSTLVASVTGKIISLWCPHTGRCTQELKGNGDDIVSIAFSHDTALIASFSRDGSARVWRTDTGDCVLKLQRLDKSGEWSFGSVAFSHDSAIIAAGPLDNDSIQFWSVADGNLLFELPGCPPKLHLFGACPFVFSHDSALIAAHLEIGRVGLWRTTTGDLVQELQSNFDCLLRSIVFSCDSALLAATARNELKLWRIASGKCIQTLRTPSYLLLESVTISHDSALVAGLSEGRNIAVWRVDTGDLVQCVDLQYDLGRSGHLSFAKDKLEILTSVGLVAVDGTGGSVSWSPCPACFVGPGIYSSWITWNEYNLLRLPAEFLHSDYAISGSTVAIRSAGRVVFIRLSAEGVSDIYG